MASASEPKQFATFYVDKMLFGIDVQLVQEIIRYQEMTPVPLAPEAIKGLINLRGQIITAIDLRTRLDLPERSADALPMNVVVRANDGTVSLLVDKIGDVLDVETDQYEGTPDMLEEGTRSLVAGVYKLEDELLLVLNAERAVKIEQGRTRE